MPSPEQAPASLPEGGKVRPIVRWGDPVMHRPARPVTTFDGQLRDLAADMVASMYAAEGVGLAACQIGIDLSIFVFDCPDADGENVVGVICNPVLTLPEGNERRLDDDQEGCLSHPGGYVRCARPDTASVAGQGLDGEAVSFDGTGLLARCLQHETDHLHGTVFGDRISAKLRKKLDKQVEKLAEEYPEGWPEVSV
jgi:peptide deformylase